MRFSNFISKPYTWSIALQSSYVRQSKAFNKSVNKASKAQTSSRLSRHFSSLQIITAANYYTYKINHIVSKKYFVKI